MDSLKTSLTTTVYKAHGNLSGAIVERLIKTRASKTFGYLSYSLDGPGPSIAILEPHGEFFNSDFGIWMGGKYFSDGCCRPIRIYKVWRYLGKRQHRAEQLPIMRHEENMIRERVVLGKHDTAALMLTLKEAEINAEALRVHMHQGQKATQQHKYNNETPTVVVHAVHINENTTLCIPTE